MAALTRISGDGQVARRYGVEEAISLEGRRFSPLLTAWLRDDRAVRRLREAFEEGRSEACRRMYEDAKQQK